MDLEGWPSHDVMKVGALCPLRPLLMRICWLQQAQCRCGRRGHRLGLVSCWMGSLQEQFCHFVTCEFGRSWSQDLWVKDVTCLFSCLQVDSYLLFSFCVSNKFGLLLTGQLIDSSVVSNVFWQLIVFLIGIFAVFVASSVSVWDFADLGSLLPFCSKQTFQSALWHL